MVCLLVCWFKVVELELCGVLVFGLGMVLCVVVKVLYDVGILVLFVDDDWDGICLVCMDGLLIFFGNLVLNYVECYFDFIGIGCLLVMFIYCECNLLVCLYYCEEFGCGRVYWLCNLGLE